MSETLEYVVGLCHVIDLFQKKRKDTVPQYICIAVYVYILDLNKVHESTCIIFYLENNLITNSENLPQNKWIEDLLLR